MGFSAYDDDDTAFDGGDLSPALGLDLLSQPSLPASETKTMMAQLGGGCGGSGVCDFDAGTESLSRSTPALASPHTRQHQHHHHHHPHQAHADAHTPPPMLLFPGDGGAGDDEYDGHPHGGGLDGERRSSRAAYSNLPRGHTFGVPGLQELRLGRGDDDSRLNTGSSHLDGEEEHDPIFDMLNLTPDGDRATNHSSSSSSSSSSNVVWPMEPFAGDRTVKCDSSSDDDGGLDQVKEEEEEAEEEEEEDTEEECGAPPAKRSKRGNHAPRSTTATLPKESAKGKAKGNDGTSSAGGLTKQRSKRGSKNAMSPVQVKRAVLNKLSKDPRPTAASALRDLQDKLQHALPNEAVNVMHWGSLSTKDRLEEEYEMLERLLGHTPDAAAPTVHEFLALSAHQRRNAKARLRSIKNRQRTRENQQKTARQLAQANETIAQQQQRIEQQEQTIAELRQTLAKLRGMSPGLDNSDVSQASSPLLP